ncbi:DnaB-like helicase C-terminal domain-containing protein [Neisseria gonorrhoeae]|uniref:DnaB-like helicase C-terminal domain-containing protein n=3 Tax=Neisseria gonorrhoeae TaxID=485 RepID=UPI000F608558|nr:DnaB-like helicase C-terminal domain-containing protein [Neisseria gonorrhoeae]AZG20862.1 DNA helicase [Neisseria gonorrhoeae]MDO6015630.1 DnaB-like helicase C-terminal domain-containing protein [Neisseria gonorrhoeae]
MNRIEETEAVQSLASVGAEQNILGGILIEPTAIARCAILTPEKFYQAQHRIIFRALLDMAAANEPIDIITLNDRFVERGLLKASAAIEKIAVSKDGGTVAEKLSKAADELAAAGKDAVKRETKTFGQTVEDLIGGLDKRLDGVRFGLPTGLMKLDGMTGGLPDGNLIVIAARPSMGKTVLAENIARFALKQGKAVHFQSYEMSAVELARRGMAAECNIPMQNLKTGNLTQSDYANMPIYVSQAKEWKFDVNCDLLNVDELCFLAKEKKLTTGLDLLVVDHLHIMPRAGRDEVAELGNISRRLKNLAAELNIPVVLVAQLNRGNTKQADKRPNMADIRGSGAIEQDANIIIMPHRESYYDGNENPSIAELIIAKNRDGETGTVVCGWKGQFMKFEEEPDLAWQAPKHDEYDPYSV